MTRYVLWDEEGNELGVLFTDDFDLLESIVDRVNIIDNASEEEQPNETYCVYCGGMKK